MVDQPIDSGALAIQFGANTDKVVPGDYTGDGKADMRYGSQAQGKVHRESEDFSFYGFPSGERDVPSRAITTATASSRDGSARRVRLVIGRTTAGTRSCSSVTGDRPLPNSYVPNRKLPDQEGMADVSPESEPGAVATGFFGAESEEPSRYRPRFRPPAKHTSRRNPE